MQDRGGRKAKPREARPYIPTNPLGIGGRKGGLRRAKNLTPEQLSEIARLGGYAKAAKWRERQAQQQQSEPLRQGAGA